MSEKKDLQVLLKTMKPILHEGNYVFCNIKDLSKIHLNDVLLFFREEESITLILKKEMADMLGLSYSFVASWITLNVHSSLEAVGFTAAFSKALAEQNISCNVVAAFYHDHIFVNKSDAEKALVALKKMLNN